MGEWVKKDGKDVLIEFGGADPYCDFAFENAKSWRLMVRDVRTGEEKQFCFLDTPLDALKEISRFAKIGVVAWAKPCDSAD